MRGAHYLLIPANLPRIETKPYETSLPSRSRALSLRCAQPRELRCKSESRKRVPSL